jgi:AcrR family transcriptional regulator
MRKRADNVEATRQRIVEAAVHLHGTVGPAGTTVAGIAAEAGVTRLTVYRHFPDEGAMFAACTAHWLSRQRQVPDPGTWTAIADPEQRLRTALAGLYAFYREGQDMLTLSHRDRATMPAGIRDALAARDRDWQVLMLTPFEVRGTKRRRIAAVIGHAMAFPTWRSLCMDQGLSDAEAVDAMTALVLTTRGAV